MTTYIPRVYYEPASEPSVTYAQSFKTSYKGFPITKPPSQHLFRIEPRESCDLPAMLDGSYTKMTDLRQQIDKYLTMHPEASADDAYIARPRGPGRPKKQPLNNPLPTPSDAEPKTTERPMAIVPNEAPKVYEFTRDVPNQ